MIRVRVRVRFLGLILPLGLSLSLLRLVFNMCPHNLLTAFRLLMSVYIQYVVVLVMCGMQVVLVRSCCQSDISSATSTASH